ncbi:hypothetical protein D5086_006330 [Populus alba]|uniref:Uncharacterized protein n=1 Tax=Populus alba TaxID=43335 RepID=A0ACC4CKD8_POPAL
MVRPKPAFSRKKLLHLLLRNPKHNEEDFKNYLIKTSRSGAEIHELHEASSGLDLLDSLYFLYFMLLEFMFPSLPFHTDLVCQFASSKASSSSKLASRSLLADAIHSLGDRELCSLLVVVSETAKFLAGRGLV